MCRLLGRVFGSLWSVSVCFLWVCAVCLGDWSVACGMCCVLFMGVCRLLGRLLRVLIRWLRPILFDSIRLYSLFYSSLLLCIIPYSIILCYIICFSLVYYTMFYSIRLSDVVSCMVDRIRLYGVRAGEDG